MADKNFYDDQDHMTRLRLWGLSQMLRGAAVAALWLTGILVALYAIWVVGQFLPEESKQAPSPYGAVDVVQATTAV